MRVVSVMFEYEGSVLDHWHAKQVDVLLDDDQDEADIERTLERYHGSGKFRAVRVKPLNMPTPVLLDDYYRKVV